MNQYGHQLQNQHRIARPNEYATISDPETFFTQLGELAQSQITELRDQILAGRRPDESLEDFRLRSYRALATAKEIVLTDLLPPTAEAEEDLTMDDDPTVASYYLRLATIDQALADTSSQAS